VSISSGIADEMQVSAAKQSADRLLNGDVMSIEPIGGGRNSQVYRLVGLDSQTYALKVYFRHATDQRDRLETEFSSLQFLWKNGVRNIPRPLVADWKGGFALYEYIDGQQIAMDVITDEEIDSAVRFLADLKNLRGHDGSINLPPASEACFSVQAIVENIQSRLKRLSDHRILKEPYPAMYEFLDGQFVPMLEEIVGWCQASLDGSNMSFELNINPAERTLSPSDFGFHNTIKCRNGQIVFLDFEYFGWDDPAKMTVDVLLHPGMSLSYRLKRRFVKGILHCFADNPHLSKRVKIVYPLFGLKWCLILLNEFLPEHLIRRKFAGVGHHDQLTLQMEQIAKAKRILDMIGGEYEHFPYFD